MDKEEVKVKRDVVQQEVVLKKLKKVMLERPNELKHFEAEKDARSELKKLKIILKEISSEEEQVKIAIRRFEAEPLFEHGNDNSIKNLKNKIEKNEKKLELLNNFLTLSDDNFSAFRDYLLQIDGKFPPEILSHFPRAINKEDIINFFEHYSEFISTPNKNSILTGLAIGINREIKNQLKDMELEKKRLENYFKINDTLVRLLKSKGAQRRLRSHTDKMNRLNEDLANYLLELEKYISVLKKVQTYVHKIG